MHHEYLKQLTHTGMATKINIKRCHKSPSTILRITFSTTLNTAAQELQSIRKTNSLLYTIYTSHKVNITQKSLLLLVAVFVVAVAGLCCYWLLFFTVAVAAISFRQLLVTVTNLCH